MPNGSHGLCGRKATLNSKRKLVSRIGLAVRCYRLVNRRTSVRFRSGSPLSSKVVICGHCLVTLSLSTHTPPHPTPSHLHPLIHTPPHSSTHTPTHTLIVKRECVSFHHLSSILLYVHRDHNYGLIGTGNPGWPLDFHAAPELCIQNSVQYCFTSTETIIMDY